VTDIVVACVADAEGGAWTCAVRVQDPGSATEHEVSVDEIDLPASLDGAETADVERLVQASFAFLLEREPKDSILRRFDLSIIRRYFPDYPDEIERRVAGVAR
jgi:hypothetical protein